MKNEKGVTLIALIITIVVLLILAAVGFSMVAGDDGILNQSTDAKTTSEVEGEKETLTLAVTKSVSNNQYGSLEQEELQETLDYDAGEGITEVIDSGEDTLIVKFVETNRYYEVDAYGNVSEYEPYVDSTPGELAQNEDGDYLIESIEDLCAFSDLTNGTDDYGFGNESTTINNFSGKTVWLMTTLDFESDLSYSLDSSIEDGGLKDTLLSDGFISISKAGGNSGSSFAGTFEGQNYSIKNIYIYEPEKNYVGLFGETRDATIKDLTVTGSITGDSEVGGISGASRDSTIQNCYNYAEITGGWSYIGGIVGMGSYNLYILNCYNYANVNSPESTRVGGICGSLQYTTSKISECYNAGDITGESSVGGIAGVNGDEIEKCCNIGSISTSLTSTNQTLAVGGITGYNNTNSEIKNCYNMGSVNGLLAYGGIAGVNYSATIDNSYSIGTIESGNYYGGIVGWIYSGTITNCYYLDTSCSKTYSYNDGTVTDTNSLTSSQMLGEDETFNFIDTLNVDDIIWVEDTNNINNGYPVLSWQ